MDRLEVREMYYDKIMHLNKEVTERPLYTIQIKGFADMNDFDIAGLLHLDILKYRNIIFKAFNIIDVADPIYNSEPPFYSKNLCTVFKTEEECNKAIECICEFNSGRMM